MERVWDKLKVRMVSMEWPICRGRLVESVLPVLT